VAVVVVISKGAVEQLYLAWGLSSAGTCQMGSRNPLIQREVVVISSVSGVFGLRDCPNQSLSMFDGVPIGLFLFHGQPTQD
jgi:hypothetical protein